MLAEIKFRNYIACGLAFFGLTEGYSLFSFVFLNRNSQYQITRIYNHMVEKINLFSGRRHFNLSADRVIKLLFISSADVTSLYSD